MPEETEEEFKARLKAISDEVKADIGAGRYRHGQLHTEIRAKKHQAEKPITCDILSTPYKISGLPYISSVAARDAWKEELISKMLELDREHSEHIRRSLMMPDYGNPYWSTIMPSSEEYHSTKEIKARETLRWKRGDFYDID